MKNTFAVIHNFLPGNLALILISNSALAAPLVRTTTGADTLDLLATAFFRKDSCGAISANGNPFQSPARLNKRKIWRKL